MRRWQKILISLATALFLILFAAAVILPEIIRDKAIEQVHEQYGRELQIERIIINLFNLQADIRKLDLKEPGSEQSFISFERLKFSISLRSLIDRALIIDDLTLDRPYVRLEKTGAQSFNFSDFIPAEKSPEPAAEESGPFHFSFNNLQIKNGNLTFLDRNNDLGLVHKIEDLNLAVPFVGNIPYLVERYIQPAISLQVDGSPLVASGQMKPFDDSIETRLELNLSNIDLAFYAAYLQPFIPFALTNGSLSTQLALSYRVSSTQQPKLLIGGDITLSALRLEQQDKPLFFLPLLLVQIDWANPFADEYHFSNISIYDPQLAVRRDAKGALNLMRLLPPAKPDSETPPATEQAPLPHLTIETLRLREGRVEFSDAVPPGGFHNRLSEINLLVQNLSTRSETPASLTFSLSSNHAEQVQLDAGLRLDNFTLEGEFNLGGLQLATYAPYLRPFLNRTPSGVATLQTRLMVTPQEQLLSGLRFSLRDLEQSFSDEDRFRLHELLVSEGRVELPQQQVQVGEVLIDRGDLALSLDEQGRLPFEKLLVPQKETAASEVLAAAEEPAWQASLKQLKVADFRARITDRSAPRPAPVGIDRFNLALNDLRWPEAVDSPWSFEGAWLAGGNFDGQGKLHHTPLTAQGTLQFERFDLTPANSYLPAELKLTLASAKLDSKLHFELEQQDKLTGAISGDLGLRSFSLQGIETELLRWESLQLSGIRADIEPPALAIDQVALNNYLAKIRVNANGEVNLNQITSAEEVSEEAPEPVTITAKTGEEATPLPPIRIDEVTLQAGELSFVDRSLPKAFSTTMVELGGRISGLTSEPGKYASVDLRGALENHAPLTISGRIAPLAGDLDTELKVRFTDIDLAPVTPYSGTYLGYAIDKGKLYLDLDYKIAGRKVEATNKIFLDQFTFGRAIESEEATGLPVRLAVALLKDRQGEIHLDLPISGSTDDPEFGIFSTVMTLLKNLLVKAATAPFSLLASMFGGGGEDFSQLDFAPGVARLNPPDLEKLAKLDQMLTERPALNLELSAFIDPQQDPEGYRKEQLRQAVEREWQKRRKPAAGTAINPEDYLENLRRVYKRAKFPKPRNAIGLLKKLPSAEMEKLLLSNTRVGDEELTRLAKQRADAVRAELLTLNPELAPRIFLKSADVNTPPQKNKNPARVEFGIAAN